MRSLKERKRTMRSERKRTQCPTLDLLSLSNLLIAFISNYPSHIRSNSHGGRNPGGVYTAEIQMQEKETI